MKLKLKGNIGLVLVFSILVKGVGAVIEIVIQWFITQKIGVSGYGDYTFYINCADIAFWCLFSGIVKCNTFYLSDKTQSLTAYKRKYFLFYMLPVLSVSILVCAFLKNSLFLVVVMIVLLQFLVTDRSSTYMARGSYGIALTGEYVIGRLVLLLGLIIFSMLSDITIINLVLIYSLQYASVIIFFFIFRRKINFNESIQVFVPMRKMLNYQQSDIVTGLIGQAPVLLQYVFVGSFETGFTGIVVLVKKLVNFISGPTAKVFLPEFSRLYKDGDYKGLRYNYQLIMRIQMLFINVLGVVLIGNTEWILSIFSPELLQYCRLFRIVSIVFLFTATLGPATGFMQMTGNEGIDNKIRWSSVIVMILVWILLRKSSLFALIGMTVEVGLGGLLRYTYVCIWFKKMPVPIFRYFLMWLPVIVSSIFAICVAFDNHLFSVILSVIMVLVLSFGIEMTDKNMRNKVTALWRKIL